MSFFVKQKILQMAVGRELLRKHILFLLQWTYRSWVIQSVHTFLEVVLWYCFKIGLESSKVREEEFQRL